MTLHKPMSIPRDSLLVTVLVTALENHQCVWLDMNRVVCCKYLFLFFSSKYTQLRSMLHRRLNAIKWLRDITMKSNTYIAKNIIKGMTLNQLVGGSNPLRPKGFTAIPTFTCDRTLDRLQNHVSPILVFNNSKTIGVCRSVIDQLTENQLCLWDIFDTNDDKHKL